MIFVGTGIVLGGLVGLLSSRSQGTAHSHRERRRPHHGLVFGWLRSTRPSFGRMPEAAIWIFDTVGLCVSSHRGHQRSGVRGGLQKTGISLVVVGLVCALVPHTVALLFGRYVLRMDPLISWGRAPRRNDHGRAPRHPGRGAEQGARPRYTVP